MGLHIVYNSRTESGREFDMRVQGVETVGLEHNLKPSPPIQIPAQCCLHDWYRFNPIQ
jgi:hypothetical protein